MSAIPTNPDAKLPRKQTAQALTEAGYRTADATLATKATRGGGPPYQLFGRLALYRWGDALDWAESRLSAPRRATSEGDAIDKAARSKSAPPDSAETRPDAGKAEPHAADKAKPSVKPSRSGEATARRRPRQRNRGEAEATTS